MIGGVKPRVAWIEMKVGFHPDAICCDGCPFCRTDTANRDRKRCVLTEEILLYTKQIGLRCPLIFDEKAEGGTQE